VAKNLYVGTDNGVFLLGLQNGEWTVQSQSFKEWQVHALGVHPAAPDRLIVTTRGDGVWLTEDRGGHWRKPSYGRPGPQKVRSLAFDPGDDRRIFAGCEPIEVCVSDDLGASWQRLDAVRRLPCIAELDYPVWTVEPHVRDIAIDPRNAGVVYAALQVGGIIKTTDGGGTWTHLTEGFDDDVHTIVLDSSDPDVVVIATGGGESHKAAVPGRALYRSADGGASWAPLAMQWQQDYSMPLVSNPHDPRVYYSAVAHGAPPTWSRPGGSEALLVRSRDHGATWEALDSGLGSPAHEFPKGIAFDPEDPATVYVALDSGILTSRDGGDTWQKQDLRLPRVYDLKCV